MERIISSMKERLRWIIYLESLEAKEILLCLLAQGYKAKVCDIFMTIYCSPWIAAKALRELEEMLK